MENLHVVKLGLEEAGKRKVLTHHSRCLHGETWNGGQRGTVLRGLGPKRWVGSGGRASEGGWMATLPAYR